MALSSPKQNRTRLGILFSLPLFFCLVFFFFQLLSERTDIHLLQIQNLESTVNVFNSLAKDGESSERAFLLTGETVSLSPFQQAKLTLSKELTFIDSYAKDTPDLLPSLRALADLARRRLEETDQVVTIQASKGFAAAIDQSRNGPGDETMNALRTRSIDLLKQLSRREDIYLKNQSNLNRGAFIFFGIGTVVMIAVMYWLYNEVLSYIDARNQAQLQLEKFNADLQVMVDERTRELVDANRELQQFAYVASHDLQEPLRTITSFSQLLAARYKSRLDADADEFISYIVTGSKRMTDLINGLLQIVRLRKPGPPSGRVPFDKLLDDAEASLQTLIRENNVTIDRGPMPELAVDRILMMQVFQNLISNAIKYRSDLPPLIKIRAQREETQWKISVSDNGLGFDQEFSERIFGLFQRLHGRDVEGTGMGLSIARKILERHGGSIWAESQAGHGATFFFTLPVGTESAKLSPPTVLPEVAKKATLTRVAKMRSH